MHGATIKKIVFDILEVVNLFCLLDMNEFHILHSVHYNSISTIQANKCTQYCVFLLASIVLIEL
jgi:hypothetical protein